MSIISKDIHNSLILIFSIYSKNGTFFEFCKSPRKHGAFFQFLEFFHSETCYVLTKDGRIKLGGTFCDIEQCPFRPPPINIKVFINKIFHFLTKKKNIKMAKFFKFSTTFGRAPSSNLRTNTRNYNFY